jgi:hypothetical protein
LLGSRSFDVPQAFGTFKAAVILSVTSINTSKSIHLHLLYGQGFSHASTTGHAHHALNTALASA